MYQESDAMNGSLDLSSDVTPKVVLSPCLEDAAADQPVKPQDAHAAYVEQQRQLLDVSPTGYMLFNFFLSVSCLKRLIKNFDVSSISINAQMKRCVFLLYYFDKIIQKLHLPCSYCLPCS